VLKLVRKNFFTLLISQMVYSMLLSFAIGPLIKGIFSLTLKLAGISFLTQENLVTYALHPLNIIIWLAVLYLISIITIFDINAINVIYAASREGRRIDLKTLLRVLLNDKSFLGECRSPWIPLYVCLLLPVGGFAYGNQVVSLHVPNFILDYIMGSLPLTVLVGIAYVAAAIICIRWIYVFLYLLKDETAFGSAARCSAHLLRRTWRRLLINMLKGAALVLLVVVCALLFETGSGALSDMASSMPAFVAAATPLFIVNVLLALVVALISKVILMFYVADVFYRFETPAAYVCPPAKVFRVPRWAGVIVGLLVVFAAMAMVIVVHYDDVAPETTVIGHRGSDIQALENTKESFDLAISQGVTSLELDVVETSDGEVVICHDLNLKRLAGVSENISGLTLAEVRDVTIYSSDGTMSGHLMTLKELVDSCPDNVVLNIEMKPTSTNADELADKVDDIIKDTPRHTVCSLKSETLKEIKRIDPTRTCGYIMAVALGNYDSADFADYYSIEESYVSEDAVRGAHAQGKKVYVWTVDDTSMAETYLDMGVDGIITDYPEEMLQAVSGAQGTYNQRQVEKLYSLDGFLG
jgi:glycerophosphoryl diester phosphodiesterase